MNLLFWLLGVPLAILVGVPLLGLAYQAVGAWWDRRRYPPPGRLVEVLGHRLHVREAGEGDITVVLEAGISASSISWAHVFPELARQARVIAYDRGGLAWSGPAKEPRVASRMVDELEALLDKLNVTGPVILVGHSYGGLLCLLYAVRNRHRVAGIVLVDPVTRSEWYPLRAEQRYKLAYGTHMAMRGALLARFGVVRFALTLLINGVRAFPKAISRTTGGRASPTVDRLVGEVRKLPHSYWPIIQAHWSVPKTFISMASHVRNLPDSIAEYDPEQFPPQVPLTVLSAETSNPFTVAEHHGDASRSLVGSHRVVPESGHWIHLDQPEAVTGAVVEMLQFVRSLHQPA